MIRLDPKTGRFWLEGMDSSLEPRMRYADFQRHPAAEHMPEIRSSRASNHREHQLPEGEFDGCRVWGKAEFTNGELESLWFQVLAEESDGDAFRYEREVSLLLELQRRWLREVVGVEADEYPWGLVWPRYNINAGWHDIAIFFKKAD